MHSTGGRSTASCTKILWHLLTKMGLRGRRKEGEKEEWEGSRGIEEEEHGRFHDGKKTSISCEAVAGDPRRDVHANAI